MSTFITRTESSGTGPRVAVKDLIDVEGVPTTAGCRAVERTAQPAARDAACLAGLRAADARIVGKANLHELAMLPLGTNPWFGNPVNPLDPDLIPGGSSSGSAVAVANDDADVALGSDTGGSVRVPSACCGTAGLKTTHGRVSLDGVWPLATNLDTIGPMATTVAGLTLGMELLEPGFAVAATPARRIGRVRTSGHPALETAVDSALRAAEVEVVDLDWDGLAAGGEAFTMAYFNGVTDIDRQLAQEHPEDVGADIQGILAMSAGFAAASDAVAQLLAEWRDSLRALFDQVELIALPTLPILPPRIDSITPDSMVPTVVEITQYVAPFNAAGVPATAQPIPAEGISLPGSLQLVGPLNSEELLLATAAVVEAAVAR
ncbi:MAG: amidase [Frankiaceae bacterium]|nr:amidase [Frankiaceae bacterium]